MSNSDREDTCDCGTRFIWLSEREAGMCDTCQRTRRRKKSRKVQCPVCGKHLQPWRGNLIRQSGPAYGQIACKGDCTLEVLTRPEHYPGPFHTEGGEDT